MKAAMKITVVGVGYVGLSNAVLLSQHNEVVALDLSSEKIEKINQRKSPIDDPEIDEYLKRDISLRGVTDKDLAYLSADYVVIATPTNYDPHTNYFDTSSVEAVIADALIRDPNQTLIIKSTVPVGFTDQMREKYSSRRIYFSPEFLREGKALYDNLHPSRIVIGGSDERATKFANLLRDGAVKENIPVLLTGNKEAEAIKLFANTYLAMRVAYFNELDTYAWAHELDVAETINGVCLDPRIGDYYNNPSFGYGGYCLPKDTKQLLANYEEIPQNIIQAVVEANETRKNLVIAQILKRNPKKIGIYRLVMKSGSDNFRDSSVVSVLEGLKKHEIEIIVFEPKLSTESYAECRVENDLTRFKAEVDLIVANRRSKELQDVREKIFSRDLYGVD